MACGLCNILRASQKPQHDLEDDADMILDSIMSQVFVVVAAGSVIAFIIRDLGEPGLAGWIIQVYTIHGRV
jgi:hypothetical protein